MKALAEFLLSFYSFELALIELGWRRPSVDPKGGGPGNPPPPV